MSPWISNRLVSLAVMADQWGEPRVLERLRDLPSHNVCARQHWNGSARVSPLLSTINRMHNKGRRNAVHLVLYHKHQRNKEWDSHKTVIHFVSATLLECWVKYWAKNLNLASDCSTEHGVSLRKDHMSYMTNMSSAIPQLPCLMSVYCRLLLATEAKNSYT